MNIRYLVLENGKVFKGFGFGADTDAVGELVFTTGMVGYTEALTDVCHSGQIIMQTFPLIGNYGVINEDISGKCAAFGYVVREWCENPSNFRSNKTIDEYLKENNVPGIWDVDTREITRLIRENGVMNAMICSQVPENLSEIKNYKVENVTVPGERKVYKAQNEKYKAVLLNFGAYQGIINALKDCTVISMPCDSKAEEIMAENPHGIILSDGPGNPACNQKAISEIKKLFGKKPMLGIGLGHQLIAISQGGEAAKMKYGHRGANQPVKDTDTGKAYITAQNHGFVVSGIKTGRVSLVNANDGTCEGIDYETEGAYSLQFRPEDSGLEFLYDKFISLMGGEAGAHR